MKRITELDKNEIFVFGSNEAGIHGAGAAKDAVTYFGAKWGQGFGLMGQSFGIPTKDWNIKKLNTMVIHFYVQRFLEFARSNPDLTFIVTPIGTGLAGNHPNLIKSMFYNITNNVKLPEEFK